MVRAGEVGGEAGIKGVGRREGERERGKGQKKKREEVIRENVGR